MGQDIIEGLWEAMGYIKLATDMAHWCVPAGDGEFLEQLDYYRISYKEIFSVDLPTYTNLNLPLNLQNTFLGFIKYNHIAVCSHMEKAEKC